MDLKSKSFIQISVSTVISQCEKMIQSIDEDRKKEWQAKIKEKVETFNGLWWNKLRGKTMTPVEAEAYLKERYGDWDFLSEYEWTMCRFEGQREKCQALIRLCKSSTSGMINLTCEDANEIGL